uniref:Tc1-like transposase DDE domain-containing protein n=1 Tax=Homalodisca liturata TaxID=320908 RepID=A0A1B6HZW5_9HEMI
MLKVELYEIIKANKPAYKRYVIDELLGEKGLIVLRLLPYHPELKNAIEFIWAEVKNWVGAHNVRFKMDEVIKLVNDKFESITVDTWKKICEHVKQKELEFIGNQGPIENVIESFIISLGEDSSEEDDFVESEDSNAADGNLSGIEELGD